MPNDTTPTILLLEDEAIIAIDMEDTLGGLDIGRVVTFDRWSDAMDWLGDNEPRLAMIDPNVKDGSCDALARHLFDRRIPFIVYSGDMGGATAVDPIFSEGAWLGKPAQPAMIEATVREALGG